MRTALRTLLLAAIILCLPVAVFSAQSLGRYEGIRTGAHHDEPLSFFDTSAWTYTPPKTINVQISFCKQDDGEAKNDGPDVFQFAFEMTLDQFERLFETTQTIQNLPVNDMLYSRTVNAQTQGRTRTVTINFENSKDADVHDVYKRGQVTIVLQDGQITSLRLLRERKRFLLGFKTVFEGEIRNLRKVKNGLALMDDGEMGRLLARDLILKALESKNPDSFKELLKVRPKKK
ncbi:MAG: hypothetical protein WA705_16475 [Candidatus Ozemobacteraceae bacterium]